MSKLPTAREISSAVRAQADPARAALLQRFFRTGPGQYGEGDVFLGLTVPQTRELTRKFEAVPLHEVKKVLASKYHEERLLALLILVRKFQRGGPKDKKDIYDLYLKERKYVNNWDLVDLSANKIVGPYLDGRSLRPLIALAGSRSLWDRRIALLASSYFIGKGSFDLTFRLVDMMLLDKEDLIHKAAGWMLREIYKRSSADAEKFLHSRYRRMPRTMLRYAIERMPAARRTAYLAGSV